MNRQALLGLAAASLGVSAFGMRASEPQLFAHRDRNDIDYKTSDKPLSKRAKRRKRGKG